MHCLMRYEAHLRLYFLVLWMEHCHKLGAYLSEI